MRRRCIAGGGCALSTAVLFSAGTGLPSAGRIAASTTRPSSASPTGTSAALARGQTRQPSPMPASSPNGINSAFELENPTTSAGIMKLLDRINRTGTTVLMATHDAHVVDLLQKRVIELDQGHVIRDDAQGGYGAAV